MPAVTKAIIPVAGYGTRRLPITKAIEKCMLPICNRPIVDYSVEECLANGITDIYFVVSPDSVQLQAYYGRSQQLEAYLKAHHKDEALASLTTIAAEANFHYIAQDLDGPYGTAVPVWLAREAVQHDERFVVMTGDDFMYTPEKPGANLKNMLASMVASGAGSAILAHELPAAQAGLYGAIQFDRDERGVEHFTGIVEKPGPGEVETNLINISKFIFDQKIFSYIEQVMQAPNERGEHFLTDALNMYAAAGNRVALTRTTGYYLDGGNLKSWIDANNTVFRQTAS